jgi:large subunit ribosomal protein L21
MFAVFEAGGRQYKARVGDLIRVDKLSEEPGSQVVFDKCLMYSDHGNVVTGKPYVDGASVKATVVEHDKDKKIIVYKYRPRKGSSRKKGHRQPYSTVKVTEIIKN